MSQAQYWLQFGLNKMNKPKVSYLILFISIWLCTSCTDNNDSYFPLTKGLKWQYDVALITRDGLSNQKYMFHNLGEKKFENNLGKIFDNKKVNAILAKCLDQDALESMSVLDFQELFTVEENW